MIPTRFVSIVVCGLWIALLPSCLPEDTRPPPAQLLVTVKTVETSEVSTLRWATEDGWTITIDRLLLSVGNASLGGSDCNGYQGGSYGRIFDMRVREAQKLSLIFGLGACELAYQLRPPAGGFLLGSGVTEADKDMMRAEQSDPWVSRKGTSLYVAGNAVRDERVKTFAWSFREQLRFKECALHGPALVADEVRTIELRVHPEALFERFEEEPGSALRFDPYAEADDQSDGDGAISLDELARRATPGGVHATLGEVVYRGLFPRTLHIDEATGCSFEVGGWRR
ncbi:MAG TPA: hypothetical protein VM580_26595 [Labilithrix sp.]|nr:hypothetical protein [Labilithrix sp.]